MGIQGLATGLFPSALKASQLSAGNWPERVEQSAPTIEESLQRLNTHPGRRTPVATVPTLSTSTMASLLRVMKLGDKWENLLKP